MVAIMGAPDVNNEMKTCVIISLCSMDIKTTLHLKLNTSSRAVLQ